MREEVNHFIYPFRILIFFLASSKHVVSKRKGRGFAGRRSEDTATYESIPTEGSGPGPARCMIIAR